MLATAIQRVLVIGGGTCGQHIAVQFSRFGYDVSIHDIGQAQMDQCRQGIDSLFKSLVDRQVLHAYEPPLARSRISYSLDPAASAADVDLVCECVPEDLYLKRKVFRQFNELCKPSAIFTSNASLLLPSQIITATGRPEQFAAMHFHIPVWYARAVDIMPHSRTKSDVVTALGETIEDIGLIPIRIQRESPGYAFNSIFASFLASSLSLVARGVVDVQDADRAWMSVTKMPIGPFGMIDLVGLNVVRDIVRYQGKYLSDAQRAGVVELLERYIERGHDGQKSDHGFYTYPEPAFADPKFAEPSRTQSPDSEPTGISRFHVSYAPAAVDARIDHSLRINGSVLLHGQSEIADCLERRLHAHSANVVRVPESIAPTEVANWMASVDRPTHLCLAGDLRTFSSAEYMGCDAYRREVEFPLLLSQAWWQQLIADDSFSKASFLTIGSSTSGWAGLAKGLSLESMSRDGVGLQAKSVSISGDLAADRCAELALAEMAMAQAMVVTGCRDECFRRQAEVQVMYDHGQRKVVRYSEANAFNGELVEDPPTGVWLVSGGARGITSLVARSLAQIYGLELHLLGRTQLPDTDYTTLPDDQWLALKRQIMRKAYRERRRPDLAWQPHERAREVQDSLRRLRDSGVNATYHACDVADEERVAEVVAQIRQAGKTVNGVLHGAGVGETHRFEAKTLDSIRATMAPKALGTSALIAATADEPLRWFVAFGSLAARFGGVGQADYCMANDILTQQVRDLRRRRPDCRCATIDWPGWKQVGMSAPPANHMMLERSSLHLLSISEGVGHFLNEIQTGLRDVESVYMHPNEMTSEFRVRG